MLLDPRLVCIALQVPVELILHKLSGDGGGSDMIVPHVKFTEAHAPVVGVVPQVGDGARQTPTFRIVFVCLAVGEGGAVAGFILVLERIKPHVRIAMVVQRIARLRNNRIRRKGMPQRWIITLYHFKAYPIMPRPHNNAKHDAIASEMPPSLVERISE